MARWIGAITIQNAIRKVMGGKNFIFRTSPASATANTILFGIDETCKANNIDSTQFLTSVMAEMSKCQNERKCDYLGAYCHGIGKTRNRLFKKTRISPSHNTNKLC